MRTDSQRSLAMESKTVYFEEIGLENTEVAFGLARERAGELGIRKLVLASTTGATAKKAMEFFAGSDLRLVVIPHQHDFIRKQNAFPAELVRELEAAGHAVHFGTMLFHTESLYGTSRPTLMANVLRCFSQGVKVCFEIVLMATDAGLLDRGERVIALAGTGRGSDTALVMQAASTQHLENLRVNELLCKPLNALVLDEVRESRSGESCGS
jgi:hypothetical protein